LRSNQIAVVVSNGQRPIVPKEAECKAVRECPKGYKALMEACWRQNPSERPKAEEVLKWIEKIEAEAKINVNSILDLPPTEQSMKCAELKTERAVSVKDRAALYEKSENVKKDDIPRPQIQIGTQKAKYPLIVSTKPPTTALPGLDEQKVICFNSSLATATPLVSAISKNITVSSAKYPLIVSTKPPTAALPGLAKVICYNSSLATATPLISAISKNITVSSAKSPLIVSTKPPTTALPGLEEQKVLCYNSATATPLVPSIAKNNITSSANCQGKPLRDETQNVRPQVRVINKLASALLVDLEIKLYGKPPPEKRHNAAPGLSRKVIKLVGNAVDKASQMYFMPKTQMKMSQNLDM